APSPPMRTESALGVGLTPTQNTCMCPECFGFVSSRGVSLSGLVFATDVPRGSRGSDKRMAVERLPVRHHERVAVLLNANAGAVSDGLRRELENFVPPEDVFYSRSLEDARAIARVVLERGYSTVLTGGGDGTFVGYVNCLFEEVARTQVV